VNVNSRLTLTIAGACAAFIAGCGDDGDGSIARDPPCRATDLPEPSSFAPPAPASLVDPLIGTRGPGNAVPGALVPHGMVKLSPDTENERGAIDAYEYDNDAIEGFTHTHLEGPGGSNSGYSQILLMPATGPLELNVSRFASGFSHATEIAKLGYYAVTLDDYGVRAELTASAHAGLHRYTFTSCDESRILVDVGHSLGRSVDGEVRVVGRDTIEGFGVYQVHPLIAVVLQGSAPDTGIAKVHFVARFDPPFRGHGTWADEEPSPGSKQATGPRIGAYADYGQAGGTSVEVRVGISFIDVEQARANLDAELADRSFEEVRDAAAERWNELLSRVEIEGADADLETMLRTSHYHALMQPADYSEQGRFWSGADRVGAVHDSGGRRFFTDDWCVWDTARTTHPWHTIVEPEIMGDLAQSFVHLYEEDGWMPKCTWHAMGDSRVMTANFQFCVIADAHAKGLRDFDVDRAYEALRKGSMQDENPVSKGGCGYFGRGTPPEYLELGYVPAECDLEQSASMTLEHAYNDFCVAELAESLGKVEDQAYFEDRSASWKNVFKPGVGFAQPRRADGSFVEPFDPESRTGFTEANSWIYSFSVPHDVCGLVQAMGGEASFVARLDEFFDDAHFDPTNEPDFHAPWLYAAIGMPSKSAQRVREIVANAFDASPGGLPGNDDAGATSAWLLFAALGFYPLAPGDPTYFISGPMLERSVLHIDNQTFVIEAPGARVAPFVQSATLNGASLTEPRLRHEDLVRGGSLVFEMGEAPSEWGKALRCPPPG